MAAIHHNLNLGSNVHQLFKRLYSKKSHLVGKRKRAYWDAIENRREFLNEIAEKLNIRELKDWGIF